MVDDVGSGLVGKTSIQGAEHVTSGVDQIYNSIVSNLHQKYKVMWQGSEQSNTYLSANVDYIVIVLAGKRQPDTDFSCEASLVGALQNTRVVNSRCNHYAGNCKQVKYDHVTRASHLEDAFLTIECVIAVLIVIIEKAVKSCAVDKYGARIHDTAAIMCKRF